MPAKARVFENAGEPMKINVGKTDRTIRLVLGVLMLTVGLFTESWWGLIGLIPIVTGMAGWCPIYAPFHLSSCKTEKSQFTPGSGVL